MVIDSHVHFWNYNKVKDAWITNDMKVLQQHFLPQNISPILLENGINGVVAVQADQSENETLFLNKLANENSIIKGIVGWVDLQHENIEERLQYFSQYPVIKGWRHIVQAEPKGFFFNPNFLKGISLLEKYNFTYDILIYPRQLKETLDFIKKFPNQKFVIDHSAKPEVKHKSIEPWKTLIKEIAFLPNVYCKLSGLITETHWKQWQAADFTAYFEVIFETFSPKRILFGSDWPVILLSGDYAQWKEMVLGYINSFSKAEQENIMGNNALQFYNL